MRTVRRASTKPFCACTYSRMDGYAYSPATGLWVHAICRKPTRMVWEKHAAGQA